MNEIDTRGWPKKATNILEKFDGWVNHYVEVGTRPPLRLYTEDYQYIAENLKDTKQDITSATYRDHVLVDSATHLKPIKRRKKKT
jgi:hypothetical protein